VIQKRISVAVVRTFVLTMIRAVVLASILRVVVTQDYCATCGVPSCKCLGKLPDSIPDVDCTFDWAFEGKCVAANVSGNITMYPADYGESCKAHKEPGSASCFDLEKSPPVELIKGKQKGWCSDSWCYIDPCDCDASDPTKSDYFPSKLQYSYETCGDTNEYVGSVGSSNTVGNAACMGMATCKCLGALPATVTPMDCTFDWAVGGKCVAANISGNLTMYPADYGTSCKVHKEPGSASCFNLTASPPVELAKDDQASWCYDKWCYIDPCDCDAEDPTKSDYFPGELDYSYKTCGDENAYTAATNATNKVGSAVCEAKAAEKAKATTATGTGTETKADATAPTSAPSTATTVAATTKAAAAADSAGDVLPSMAVMTLALGSGLRLFM